MEPDLPGNEALILEAPGPPVTSFCVPTRNRPENLNRCLASYIQNFNRYERSPDIIVSDDSTSFSTRRKNRKLASFFSDHYPGKIIYLDRKKRGVLISILASHLDVPKATLRFGLVGDDLYKTTYGANRNTLLLLTLGTSTIHADDDTICELGTPPESDESGEVLISDAPFEHWFYQTAGDAFAASAAIEASFPGLFEKFLGRTVSNVDKHMPLHGKRIVCTVFGHAGDCANATYWRLFATGKSGQRIRKNLPWSLSTRFIIGSSSQSCVAEPRPFATMCVGFNTASYLPPFVPCFRNEDGLFGRMLAKCSREYVFGYLPYSIQHHPPGQRATTEFELDSRSPRVSLPVLLEWILEAWTPDQDELEANTVAFGRHLTDIGSLRAADFANFAKDVGGRSYRRQLERTEASLAVEDDDEVRKILYNFMTYQRDILANPNAFVPRFLHVKLRSGRSVPQDFLYGLGELFSIWPEVISKARRLDFSNVVA